MVVLHQLLKDASFVQCQSCHKRVPHIPNDRGDEALTSLCNARWDSLLDRASFEAGTFYLFATVSQHLCWVLSAANKEIKQIS